MNYSRVQGVSVRFYELFKQGCRCGVSETVEYNLYRVFSLTH